MAVVGHVDRSLELFLSAGQNERLPQIGPFRNSLGFILGGAPVGHAIAQQFGQRFAALSTVLLGGLRPPLPLSCGQLTATSLLIGWSATTPRITSCWATRPCAFARRRSRGANRLLKDPRQEFIMNDTGIPESLRHGTSVIRTDLEGARPDAAGPRWDTRRGGGAPGYQYPPTGKPEPAVVVAVTPGTSPVKAAAGQARLRCRRVDVIDATVEEQVAAQRAVEVPASFTAMPDQAASTLETLLTGEDMTEFGPPKEGAYEPSCRRICRLSTSR